jgi:hypothetical protein
LLIFSFSVVELFLLLSFGAVYFHIQVIDAQNCNIEAVKEIDRLTDENERSWGTGWGEQGGTRRAC